jgi:hypothetical protein
MGVAVVDVFPGEIIGVLAHVESAHEHRAGGFEACDQRRVLLCGRVVTVDLRSGDGRHPCDIEQVLDRERHPGERAHLCAVLTRGVDRVGAGERTLIGDGGERVERSIQRGDTRERARHHVAGADLAIMDGVGNRVGGCPSQVHE